MATQIQAPKANGFSVLMDHDAQLEATREPLTSAQALAMAEEPENEPLTEDEVKRLNGLPSMAEMMRAMLAEELAKMRSAMVPQAVTVQAVKGKGKQASTVHVARHAKPSNARIETPKAVDNRPWYQQALTRVNKKTGTPFYSIETKSVMVNGNVAIARSNKWAPALLLIQGRRKPIYLNAVTLAALADSNVLLSAFAKANHDYLAQSMTEGDADDE